MKIKKIILNIIALSLLWGPANIHAQDASATTTDIEIIMEAISGENSGPDGNFEVASYAAEFNSIGQNTSLRGYILNVLNFILSFLGLLCIAVTIYGGFLYITATGDDGKMEIAKKLISYVVIGIIVILMSFALINTVIQNAGTGGDDRGGTIPADTSSESSIGSTTPRGTTSETTRDRSDSTRLAIIDQLLHESPIVIYGDENAQIKDLGMITWIAPEYALSGVQIGLNRSVDSIIYYGDGIQERLNNTSPNPNNTKTHVYVGQGKKVIRVIANESGRPATYSREIHIGGIDAVIRAPITANTGDTILLDGSLSHSFVGGITQYRWSCPDGATGCDDGTTSTATITEVGNQVISLTIYTNFGVTRTATHTIQVKPAAGDPINVDFYINTDT